MSERKERITEGEIKNKNGKDECRKKGKRKEERERDDSFRPMTKVNERKEERRQKAKERKRIKRKGKKGRTRDI